MGLKLIFTYYGWIDEFFIADRVWDPKIIPHQPDNLKEINEGIERLEFTRTFKIAHDVVLIFGGAMCETGQYRTKSTDKWWEYNMETKKILPLEDASPFHNLSFKNKNSSNERSKWKIEIFL